MYVFCGFIKCMKAILENQVTDTLRKLLLKKENVDCYVKSFGKKTHQNPQQGDPNHSYSRHTRCSDLLRKGALSHAPKVYSFSVKSNHCGSNINFGTIALLSKYYVKAEVASLTATSSKTRKPRASQIRCAKCRI